MRHDASCSKGQGTESGVTAGHRLSDLIPIATTQQSHEPF